MVVTFQKSVHYEKRNIERRLGTNHSLSGYFNGNVMVYQVNQKKSQLFAKSCSKAESTVHQEYFHGVNH